MRRLNFCNFPLQFITNGKDGQECACQAQKVLEGGCRWVQLRMKDARDGEIEETAKAIKLHTDNYGATFIIDDKVEICKRVGASGVHLGKNDMSPEDARKVLGDDFIIGGTCNTLEDILAVKDYVDYIGCGPFRFTTTKKNLAPTLGLDGYKNLVWECRSQGVNIPIVAIGGITLSDIGDVLQAGPDGIAMSGEIIRSANMSSMTAQVVEAINSSRPQL